MPASSFKKKSLKVRGVLPGSRWHDKSVRTQLAGPAWSRPGVAGIRIDPWRYGYGFKKNEKHVVTVKKKVRPGYDVPGRSHPGEQGNGKAGM